MTCGVRPPATSDGLPSDQLGQIGYWAASWLGGIPCCATNATGSPCKAGIPDLRTTDIAHRVALERRSGAPAWSEQPATPDPTRSTSVIAFATSDFPSVLQGFLHTEQQECLTPASQNAHNIRIFLAPAHSKRVHNRRSRVRADRVARESRSYAPGRN